MPVTIVPAYYLILTGHSVHKIRTCDLVVPNDARYQTAPHPVKSLLRISDLTLAAKSPSCRLLASGQCEDCCFGPACESHRGKWRCARARAHVKPRIVRPQGLTRPGRQPLGAASVQIAICHQSAVSGDAHLSAVSAVSYTHLRAHETK